MGHGRNQFPLNRRLEQMTLCNKNFVLGSGNVASDVSRVYNKLRSVDQRLPVNHGMISDDQSAS